MKFGKSFVLSILFLLFPFIASAAPATPSVLSVDEAKAIISGVTPNNTDVIVYVDDEFLGVAQVVLSEAESNNFSFSFFGLLSAGTHELKVAAKDIETRSLSKFSDGESFFVTVANSNQPKVSEEAVEEVVEENATTTEEEVVETEDEYLLDIDDITEPEEEESNNNENILRWNLVIFILFLIAIISWIFWVNHELKKEKEEQEKQE